MLPGTDGLEVCRHLKREVGTREVPILMHQKERIESNVQRQTVVARPRSISGRGLCCFLWSTPKEIGCSRLKCVLLLICEEL